MIKVCRFPAEPSALRNYESVSNILECFPALNNSESALLEGLSAVSYSESITKNVLGNFPVLVYSNNYNLTVNRLVASSDWQ